MSEPCPDCIRAEAELWPVFGNHACCWARGVAETVGRSGKGWPRARVQAQLIARITGRANDEECAAFFARLEQLGVEVGQ